MISEISININWFIIVIILQGLMTENSCKQLTYLSTDSQWLLVHGSWLRTHRSRIRAKGGGDALVMSHAPWPLRLEPWGTSHEPSTIDKRLIDIYITLNSCIFLQKPSLCLSACLWRTPVSKEMTCIAVSRKFEKRSFVECLIFHLVPLTCKKTWKQTQTHAWEQCLGALW